MADSILNNAAVNIVPDKKEIADNERSVNIYPNPAKNKISMQVQGFDPGIIQVKITDTKGKLCRQDNRLLTNGREEIAMFLSLIPGIYFVSLNQKDKVVKKKLVIF
ncbi:MAG: T9SS type A sorting domain-containing protein [Ferruginibacter sp.]